MGGSAHDQAQTPCIKTMKDPNIISELQMCVCVSFNSAKCKYSGVSESIRCVCFQFMCTS